MTKHLSFWSSLSILGTNFAKIFCIFSSSRIIVCTVPTLTSNCALIVSIDTRRSLSMKFFIWPINSGLLTSLLLPHLSSSLTDSLPSLNLLCHSKTDAWFMQDAPKAVWSIPYVSVAFFSSLKQIFIAYLSSKVSSRPDCIFEIHQLWQSGFIRVYSNCCYSYSFEPEIIKIGQSSHKMHSNSMLNFQVSTTILNACTKKSGNLLKAPRTIGITVTFMFHFFSVLLQGRGIYLSFRFLSGSSCSQPGWKSSIWQVFFFLFFFFFFFFFFWLSLGLVVWFKLGDPFVSQNPREVYTSHLLWQILGCVYTICS